MALNVEIFSSPGCGKCGHAKQLLKKMVSEMGENDISWREINILEELDYAVSLGVLSTPAIAMNGELIFHSLPSAKKLHEVLISRLSSNNTVESHATKKAN